MENWDDCRSLTEWMEELGFAIPEGVRDRADSITIDPEDFHHTQEALQRIKRVLDKFPKDGEPQISPAALPSYVKRAISREFHPDFQDVPQDVLQVGSLFYVTKTYDAAKDVKYAEQNRLWHDLCKEAGLTNKPLIIAESDFSYIAVTPYYADGYPGGKNFLVQVSTHYLDTHDRGHLAAMFRHEIKHILEMQSLTTRQEEIELGYSPASTMEQLHAKEFRCDDYANQHDPMSVMQAHIIGDSYIRSKGAIRRIISLIADYNIERCMGAEKEELAQMVEERKAGFDRDDFAVGAKTHPPTELRVDNSWQAYVAQQGRGAAITKS